MRLPDGCISSSESGKAQPCVIIQPMGPLFAKHACTFARIVPGTHGVVILMPM